MKYAHEELAKLLKKKWKRESNELIKSGVLGVGSVVLGVGSVVLGVGNQVLTTKPLYQQKYLETETLGTPKNKKWGAYNLKSQFHSVSPARV